MPFIWMDIDAPDGPTTDDFILRPIVAADAELDRLGRADTRPDSSRPG